MTDAGTSRSRAAEEAADWHSRLGRPSVSAADLEAFRRWRADPGNADAYRDIETVWRRAGDLRADPDIAALTHRTVEAASPARPAAMRRFILPGAAMAVLALATVCGSLLWAHRDPVYQTGIGERRTVRLSDGSIVELDTATRLRILYRSSERGLELLDGQALFTVAHDSGRPFVVRSGSARVTAVGTVFEVRREPAGARVTLVSGVVDVRDAPSADARRWRLAAGQQLDTAAPRAVAAGVDIGIETSWTQGRLVFANTPLVDAVAEVNRYLEHPIVLEGPRAGSVKVSGAFNTGDREAFAAAAVDLFDLQRRVGPDGALVLRDATQK